MSRRRTFAYRVYFTAETDTYYVVGAPNARAAVRRGKRSWRAFAISNKDRRLKVLKVERLYRGGVARVLKTGALRCDTTA